MKVVELSEGNFKSEILDHKGLAVVDFWAAWCGPCRMMGPIFEEAAGEDKIAKWGKLNVDEAQSVAGEFGVMSIPTLIIFKDGKKIDQMVGAQDKETLLSQIKKHA